MNSPQESWIRAPRRQAVSPTYNSGLSPHPGQRSSPHYLRHLATPTGYYSFTWPSLHRGEQLQLRSYLTGFPEDDPVTVYETVKLRPDLAVQDLTFPITAIVQQVVNIRASISELNGDAGATITCVLAIDGTNLDQANTVYVDAGGGVTCEFSHTFSTAGTHSIQVTAANPVPGDWDLSNNTAAASITISAANTEHATALFLDSNVNGPLQKQTYQLSYQGNAVYSYSSFGSSVHLQGSSTLLQDYGCTGSTNAASWNLPVSISYTESMDGTQLYSFSDSGLSASGPSLAVVPFPLCSSTAESVVAQYGSNLKNDHFAYIRICAISRQHGEPPLLLAICRCAAGGGRRHLLLPCISVLFVEQLQQSCRLLFLEYVGPDPLPGERC